MLFRIRRAIPGRLIKSAVRAAVPVFAAAMVFIGASRGATAACLRILGFDLRPQRTPGGILALITDVDRGRVLRESRFPARSEIGYSLETSRALYYAAEPDNPNEGMLIVQGGSGLLSEDLILQRRMSNFIETSVYNNAILWSRDGSTLTYIWSQSYGDPRLPSMRQFLSVANIKTGEQRTQPLPAGHELCCLDAYSPDMTYVSARAMGDARTTSLFRLDTLQPVGENTSFTVGGWLPGGHDYIGVQSERTPNVFIRFVGDTLTQKPINLPITGLLHGLLSPDGHYLALESVDPLCSPTQPCVNQHLIYDILDNTGAVVQAHLEGIDYQNYGTTYGRPAANARWSPDGKQFYYLAYPPTLTTPGRTVYTSLSDLVVWDAETRQSSPVLHDVLTQYGNGLVYPQDNNRYHSAAAYGLSAKRSILALQAQDGIRVTLSSLDGSTPITLVDKLGGVAPLSGQSFTYGDIFGWGADGETIIVPWVRPHDSAQESGITWMRADGTNRHELTGWLNVGQVDVAVDMTRRIASRWIGLTGDRNGTATFELLNIDSGRTVRVTLPAPGRSRGWTTWFSYDNRYVVVYIEDRGATNAKGYMYSINLETGTSVLLPDGYSAAWSRTGDQVAFAHGDPVTEQPVIDVVTPEGQPVRRILLDNFDLFEVRTMSWNACY